MDFIEMEEAPEEDLATAKPHNQGYIDKGVLDVSLSGPSMACEMGFLVRGSIEL